MHSMTKNALFIIISVLITSLKGYSQNSLTGKVTDKTTHETIPGASLYLPDLKRNTITDTAGKYTISGLPAGKFIIEVKVLGYTSINFSSQVKGVTVKDIELEETKLEGGEIVVTGVSHATDIKLNPMPIVVIDQNYLNTHVSTNLIDGLSRIPGISAVTTGPGVSKPFIRGLGYNRVITLNDGVRQEGQQWGDEHGIEIDEYSADRIEILKGPASLIYGSDGLAGVINILPPKDAPEGHIIGDLVSNYQTNNGLIGNSLGVSGNTGGYTWMLRGSHKNAEDYQNKYDGRVYGTAFNETDLDGSVGINRSWGYSHINVSIFDQLLEIPDGTRDSATGKFTKPVNDSQYVVVPNNELNTYKISDLHQHVQHYKVFSNNNVTIGDGRLSFNIGYQQSIRREYSNPENINVPGLYLFLQTGTYDFKYAFADIKGWEPTIGVNGMYQINENKGTEFLIPDYRTFDAGGFAYVKKSFARLNVSGGIRYDIRNTQGDALYLKDDQVVSAGEAGAITKFNAFNKDYSGASASIGATYNVSENLLLKGNIARGYRAPSIAEISANGVHDGTVRYDIGDPNLKPEFSLQEDLGLSFTSTHVSIDAEVFNNDIQNFIYLQKLLNHNGTDSIIVPGNQTFKYVSGDARLYGGELSIDIHPHPLDWLHFENTLSIVYALNKSTTNDSNKYLPFIPPVHTNSELRANFKKRRGIFENSYAKVEMQYFFAQNQVLLEGNTETPTPGYTLFDAGVGADIINKKGHKLFSLHILANNIFDVAYQNNLSRLKYLDENFVTGRTGIYDMGRNISIKAIIPFDVK